MVEEFGDGVMDEDSWRAEQLHGSAAAYDGRPTAGICSWNW